MVLRDQSVPEEVLATVLVEVEGILNFKPLRYVSSDVANPDPVTPNLLLMGQRDASLPQALYRSDYLLERQRYRHSQVIADHFWSQFIKGCLPNLRLRQKWTKTTGHLSVGQVVLVMDYQLPRAMCPDGRVSSVLQSDDGRIPTAEVNINGKRYLRPVAKLIELAEMPEDVPGTHQ